MMPSSTQTAIMRILTFGLTILLSTASAIFLHFESIKKRDETQESHYVIRDSQNSTDEYLQSPVVYQLSAEQLVQELVDWAQLELKSFLHDIHFDFKNFDNRAERIQAYIADGEYFLPDIAPDSLSLSEKVAFSKHMLHTMIDASESLKFYSSTDSIAQTYVCKIIHLHVALFAFYDAYGSPNPAIPRFTKNIKRHKNNVRIWEGIFSALPDVPLSVRTMFEAQMIEVNIILGILSTYIHD